MATRNTLHVEVVTAERELFNGEVDSLQAPGLEGQLGILPQHAPLLSVLGVGPLELKQNGKEQVLFVAGGFLEVSNDRVTVLADVAENAEEIDQARAEAARSKAEERLGQPESNQDRADAQKALQRALNRLKAIEIARRSHR